MELTAFYSLGGVAVVTALLMVTRKNPIAAALWLVVCFFAFAGLFVTLSAHFLGVIQVLLYAGAIMVLFIFVIMLLNIGNEELRSRQLRFPVVLGVAAAVYFLVLVGVGLLKEFPFPFSQVAHDFGNAKPLGLLLFTRYLIPFELVSVLLLVAIVGAVVLGKRKL